MKKPDEYRFEFHKDCTLDHEERVRVRVAARDIYPIELSYSETLDRIATWSWDQEPTPTRKRVLVSLLFMMIAGASTFGFVWYFAAVLSINIGEFYIFIWLGSLLVLYIIVSKLEHRVGSDKKVQRTLHQDCRSCGYDLSGLTSMGMVTHKRKIYPLGPVRCPECGQEYPTIQG